jgi:hypothetical protein
LFVVVSTLWWSWACVTSGVRDWRDIAFSKEAMASNKTSEVMIFNVASFCGLRIMLRLALFEVLPATEVRLQREQHQAEAKRPGAGQEG